LLSYAVLLLSSVGVVNAQNADCFVTVPLNPLTAQGLATPYLLSTKDTGPCTMMAGSTVMSQAFVQGGIYDPFSAVISVYNPLIADQTPVSKGGIGVAITPVVPNLPSGAVVALWFGSNGATLTLVDTNLGATLKAANCVNGLPGSIFGQFSYCNAVNFFERVYNDPRVFVPYLGKALDGQLCPTVRDFFVVDQDPSDNVVSDYLVTNNGIGLIAQDNPVNREALAPNKTVFDINGSDNRLLAVFLAQAIQCYPATGPDLSDTNHINFLPALPLDELSANFRQPFPQARVEIMDPMVLGPTGNYNVTKLNLYRAGVGQPAFPNLGTAFNNEQASIWCQRSLIIFPTRLETLLPFLVKYPTVDNPPTATNLGGFMANRWIATWGLTGCNTILNIQVNQLPVIAVVSATTGLTTSVKFNFSQIPEKFLLAYLLQGLDDTGEVMNSTTTGTTGTSAAPARVIAPQFTVLALAFAVAAAVATFVVGGSFAH